MGKSESCKTGRSKTLGVNSLRLVVNLGEQFGGGELRVASNETTVSPPKRLPFAVHVEEKECRLLRDFHLRVKAELVENFIARRQVGDERLRFFHRFAVHGPRQFVQSGVERIEKNYSASLHEPGEQFAEGRAEGFAVAIRRAQSLGDCGKAGAFQ